jgi:hypothetical protein
VEVRDGVEAVCGEVDIDVQMNEVLLCCYLPTYLTLHVILYGRVTTPTEGGSCVIVTTTIDTCTR